MKIISLVPSITELLFSLKLDKEVVGITKFCIHPPEWQKTKTIVGGTKNIHIEKIRSLKPDLIIANKEENVKEQIEALKDYNVVVTDVNSFDTALEMIATIGKLVHKESEAEKLATTIKQGFSELNINNYYSAIYLIWSAPYMTIGGDTYIHSIMQKAGFENAFGNSTRYPKITEADMLEKNPDFVLLSTEPYPFKEKHVEELQALLPKTKIILVGGEMFSWYGSRMLEAANYLKKLKHIMMK